jgi:hypothetical protein
MSIGGEARVQMPNRRDVLALGACATLDLSPGVGRASASAAMPAHASLQTRLFNLKDGAAPQTISDLLLKLRALGESPGIDSLLIGRNFIATPFPSRFEWIYMVQLREPPAHDTSTAYSNFKRLTDTLSSVCRNEAQCDLGSSFPPRFADAAGVKVRHTVMFDFKPDASPEARERNVAAIRTMGTLPMVQKYFVERSSVPASGPNQLEWQVIGDFGSVEDYRAYSQAPVHLAIRRDFRAHTSRVAFLDVAL